MKIGIIGTGVFSTAIAITLASNKDNKIVMWSENETLVADFKKTKKLNTIFKDKSIPKNINVTTSYEEALEEAEVVFLLPGVTYLDQVCKDLKAVLNPTIPVIVGTKGIEEDGKRFVHQVAKRHLRNPIAVLSGPSFASDVANLDPVGFVLACKDKKAMPILERVLAFDDVKITHTKDLDGTAVCGCVKNIYAIGAGILRGLSYGKSTEALYLTRVYEELGEILYAFHSSLEIQQSLAGFGDLLLTCTSTESRNNTYGEFLGKKNTKKDMKKYAEEHTVEGLHSLTAIYRILKRKRVKAPILYTIYAIAYEEENPRALVDIIIK